MKIAAFAKLAGVSPYTLRYYESIGLLTVSRDQSGHRNYTDKDIDWITFINRLRETAMPLKDIKQYAQWRMQGESTIEQRKRLLEQHAKRLKKVIENEQKHLAILQAKITFYNQCA